MSSTASKWTVTILVFFLALSGAAAQDSITVSGTVKDNVTEEPLGEAAVFLSYRLGNWLIGEYNVLSGEDGTYSVTIPRVVAASGGMVTAADGYNTGRESFSISETTVGIEKNFLLEALPPEEGDPVVVSGVIRTTYPEEPVAGAVITIKAGTGSDAVTAEGTSSADGSFSISLLNGPKAALLTASISAEGYLDYESGPYDNLSISSPADGITDTLKYFNPNLTPEVNKVTWTLAGVLTDELEGTPVEGAQVTVMAGGEFMAVLASGADGAFSASIEVDETADRLSVEIISSGYERIYSAGMPSDSATDGHFDLGEIALTPESAWHVSGTIVDSATLSPLADIQVEIMGGGEKRTVRTTNASGEFTAVIGIPSDSSGVMVRVTREDLAVYEIWLDYDPEGDGHFDFGTLPVTDARVTSLIRTPVLADAQASGTLRYGIDGRLRRSSNAVRGITISRTLR